MACTPWFATAVALYRLERAGTVLGGITTSIDVVRLLFVRLELWVESRLPGFRHQAKWSKQLKLIPLPGEQARITIFVSNYEPIEDYPEGEETNELDDTTI